MGYRSNVAVVVKGGLSTKLLDSEDFIQPDTVLQESGWTLYHWNWIKWYNSYPEIKAIEEYLATLPELDYSFLRVGEESGDIDYSGLATMDNDDCPFFASYSSSIEFGNMNVPDWKNNLDKIVRQANQFESVADREIWEYLCQQVDEYRNSL